MKTIHITTLLVLASLTLFNSCSEDCVETVFYLDADGDGYGSKDHPIATCERPANYVTNFSDPDDSDPDISPENFWLGPKITFTKADGADFTKAENQDRITDNVWITRGNRRGIYNAAVEDSFTQDSYYISPEGTEWAMGTLSKWSELEFAPWVEAVYEEPPYAVGKDMVLHLKEENIYIQVKFLSWSSGDRNGKGGFSYERSTPSR